MATISDVAKRAGVSTVTVSRVINDERNVSAATREKVETAIAELGYVPNVAARSLRSKRTHALGLIVPDITNAYWTTVARGVEDTAQSYGYSVLFCNTDENPDKQRHYLQIMASQRVDGVMIAPCNNDPENLRVLRVRNIPTVIIDRRVKRWDVDSVRGDSISGARALVRHLIEVGHRRIGVISGPVDASTADDRIAGYCMALREAGIPIDPSLIKRGAFKAAYGEQLIYELLALSPPPTAVFAANNLIALGVVEGLARRGLRIPQDMGVVCFDDLPDASLLFPFLTVTVQPAYDMGMHAAQLLVSRLESDVALKPRHVRLPTRLIIRYSCGSRLRENGSSELSLPVLRESQVQSILVKPLAPDETRDLPFPGPVSVGSELGAVSHLTDYDKPDSERLRKALRHQEPDRVPYLETRIRSRSVCEYVLERELKHNGSEDLLAGQIVTPEDHVEFAQRLGMDAVVCSLLPPLAGPSPLAEDGFRPLGAGAIKDWADIDRLAPGVPLADLISCIERYLRAAHGTGVGVVAGVSSFLAPVVRAVGTADAARLLEEEPSLFERLLDMVLQRQERIVRAVCDRFADDLALVLVEDHLPDLQRTQLSAEACAALFLPRLERLIAPAVEHNTLTAFHSLGRMDWVMPVLVAAGFDAVHPLEPEHNDIYAAKERWGSRLALMGNLSATRLADRSEDEIEHAVRECCTRLAPGGGYVFSTADGVVEGVSPQVFVTMAHAVHTCGRYDVMAAGER